LFVYATPNPSVGAWPDAIASDGMEGSPHTG
jgi:hypothetical protein